MPGGERSVRLNTYSVPSFVPSAAQVKNDSGYGNLANAMAISFASVYLADWMSRDSSCGSSWLCTPRMSRLNAMIIKVFASEARCSINNFMLRCHSFVALYPNHSKRRHTAIRAEATMNN